MPIGSILLVIVAVAAFFGLLQRTLDRMGLTDRATVLWIAAIIAGSYLDLPLIAQPELRVNVGGGLVPLVLAGYLYTKAAPGWERNRAILAPVGTAVVVYALARLLPADATDLYISPLYVYAIAAGTVAYLLGRSRRSAFIAGTVGVVLTDLFHYIEIVARDLPGRTWVGGAGAFDAVIVAGVLAVGLAEVVGEFRERLVRLPRDGGEKR